MLNPHPPLTGFPFTILTLIIFFELTATLNKKNNWRLFAKTLLALLCIASIATYFSGYWGIDHANGSFQVPAKPIELHQIFAKLYLLSLVPCSLFALLESSAVNSKMTFYYFYLFFLLISYLLIIYVGYLGGGLVFEYGAGVKLSSVSTIIFH